MVSAGKDLAGVRADVVMSSLTFDPTGEEVARFSRIIDETGAWMLVCGVTYSFRKDKVTGTSFPSLIDESIRRVPMSKAVLPVF